jgi:hypothetical protein
MISGCGFWIQEMIKLFGKNFVVAVFVLYLMIDSEDIFISECVFVNGLISV